MDLQDQLRAVLNKHSREDAFDVLVKLVAEYGWLCGRMGEEVAPLVRSACYKEELHMGVDTEGSVATPRTSSGGGFTTQPRMTARPLRKGSGLSLS